MERARGTPRFPALSIIVALAGLFVGASPVLGQTPTPGVSPPRATGSQMGVVAPPPAQPTPDFGFEPAIPPEQGRAREEEFYPEPTRSIHQPAFVKSANTTIRTSRTSGVRVGLSGWTAPRVPFDMRESSGGVAFGLTIEWGTPLEPPVETPPVQR